MDLVAVRKLKGLDDLYVDCEAPAGIVAHEAIARQLRRAGRNLPTDVAASHAEGAMMIVKHHGVVTGNNGL